jgi:flagellar protein FlaF
VQYQGYGTIQRETSGGRSLEREMMERVTIRLRSAIEDSGPGESRLHEALRANRSLWMAFAADLASPNNTCPDTVKAALISLAAFIERNTRAAMSDEGMLRSFIAINDRIAAGLGEKAVEAA